MSTWTKLHILQTVARYSPALYAVGGGLVTATALTISIVAAIYLAAAFAAIGIIVWNEYDRAKTRAWLDQDRAEWAAIQAEWAGDNYGRHARP